MKLLVFLTVMSFVSVTIFEGIAMGCSNLPTAKDKCKGEWEKGVCLQGNGKRADPNMNSDSSAERSLLHRALLSDAERLSQMLQVPLIAADPLAESDNTAPERSVALSTDDYDYGDITDGADERYNSLLTRHVPDVRDLRRYIRTLV